MTLHDNPFGSMRGRAGDASNVGPPIQPPVQEAIDVRDLPAVQPSYNLNMPVSA